MSLHITIFLILTHSQKRQSYYAKQADACFPMTNVAMNRHDTCIPLADTRISASESPSPD